jgi:hypothetical protein
MRQYTRSAAAAVTVAIALSVPGNQPSALPGDKTPLVVAATGCPRLVRPKCPKYYTAACTQWSHGWARRCCVKMGCVPQPR